MKTRTLLVASAALLAALPSFAEEVKPPSTPSEFVAAAKADEWVAIAPSDLLIMDLAPDAKGKSRQVVIQLMPAPFSQGWVGNIKKLAAAHWWDGTSINRVQDNYVVQWGDATEKKALPDGLVTVPESGYGGRAIAAAMLQRMLNYTLSHASPNAKPPEENPFPMLEDVYASNSSFLAGWPVALTGKEAWPVHCYAMVGVGRNVSPDTGTGAELYTVIGHAPRHLDRNIALVGRVIEGIENLSSLPRGTGPLGFYEKEEERVSITSVRLANELPATDQPEFEYLSTESQSFARYTKARANRKDDFFITPAGGADICNVAVPIRRKAK